MTINYETLAKPEIQGLVPYQVASPACCLAEKYGIRHFTNLANNEMAETIPAAIQTAILSGLSQVHRYPEEAHYQLQQQLAAHLGLDAACLALGNGSENILELIIKSYLQAGDAAVIAEYTFLAIPILLQSYGAVIKVAPALNYGHDVQQILKAIDGNTKMVFIVNPNNPTGTYLNTLQMETLLANIPAHVLVIVDEAYAEFMLQHDDYPHMQHYLKQYPNLIVTRTFSKAYGLAGLRLGYAMASASICKILEHARMPYNVNTLAAIAGRAAIKEQTLMQARVQETLAIKQSTLQQLQRLGFHVHACQGNFLLLEVKSAEDTYQQLLRLGFIVKSLQAYNLPHLLRITIGTSEQMAQFISALQVLKASALQSP